MKPFARIMLLTLGFGLLSAAIGVFTTPSGRAAASSLLNVFVTNTSSTPVPVSGTVTVSGMVRVTPLAVLTTTTRLYVPAGVPAVGPTTPGLL